MISISAEIKKEVGKSSARALRRIDRIPAVIYGGKEVVMASLVLKDFLKEYTNGSIQSKIIELDFGSSKITTILKSIQFHPVTDVPEHIDFQEVSENSIVKVAVRVIILNEDKCPGVKKGGVLNIPKRSVVLYCPPVSIPAKIEVDVIKLEIGHNIHINDIQLPLNVRPIDDSNFVIASISGRVEESAEAAAESSSDKK